MFHSLLIGLVFLFVRVSQASDFIAFANYYRIQLKIAEWAISWFYAPGTPNIKLYFAMFCNFKVLVIFFANLIYVQYNALFCICDKFCLYYLPNEKQYNLSMYNIKMVFIYLCESIRKTSIFWFHIGDIEYYTFTFMTISFIFGSILFH